MCTSSPVSKPLMLTLMVLATSSAEEAVPFLFDHDSYYNMDADTHQGSSKPGTDGSGKGDEGDFIEMTTSRSDVPGDVSPLDEAVDTGAIPKGTIDPVYEAKARVLNHAVSVIPRFYVIRLTQYKDPRDRHGTVSMAVVRRCWIRVGE